MSRVVHERAGSVAVKVKNIFSDCSDAAMEEEFLELFANRAVRIERIVSPSRRSPSGFWYDQDEDEWVMVLRGGATLEFDSGEIVAMNQGDYLLIPAHMRHRVAETEAETIWLAVHLKPAR